VSLIGFFLNLEISRLGITITFLASWGSACGTSTLSQVNELPLCAVLWEWQEGHHQATPFATCCPLSTGQQQLKQRLSRRAAGWEVRQGGCQRRYSCCRWCRAYGG